jgi:polar amino acid transport system substrate-binding protein
MRKTAKTLFAPVAAAILGVMVQGVTAIDASAEVTLESIKAAGKISVGFANEAPYGHMTADGVLTGEAPEVARVVFSNLGEVELEAVLTEFGSLIPGLKAGRFDMISAGMYILPKRCKEIDFSNPTLGLGQGMVVAAGNPKGIHSFEDIANNPEAKLVVVAGGVERDYARKTGIPDDQVLVVPDFPTATASVQTGRGDAVALTALSAQNLIDTANDPGIERARPFTDPVIDGKVARGYSGYGFRKENTELRDFFNQELAKFVGTPEHLALIGPFGFTESELPGDKTAAQLCAGE